VIESRQKAPITGIIRGSNNPLKNPKLATRFKGYHLREQPWS